MISWVFFDIGNVLMIDEPLGAMRWEVLYQAILASGRTMRFEDLMQRREYLVRHCQDVLPQKTLALELLGEEGWADVQKQTEMNLKQDFMAYNFLLDGAKDILEAVSSRYHLALAANQPKVVFRKAMMDAGLLRYFKVVGISDEMGLKKPDAKFFQAVLAEAGCAAGEAIMVGDRMDNDIAPAQKLGMHTIWFNLNPAAQGYTAGSRFERLYIESLYRAPSRGVGPENTEVKPDAVVTDSRQLLPAIESVVEENL